MTKLAIMEKNKKQDEKAADSYYKSDYVYIHNFKTRLAVSVVYFCYIAGYYLNQIYRHNVNPLVYNIPQELSKIFIVYGIMLLAFTVLSSIIYKMRYKKVATYNTRYMSLLKQLKEKRGEND